VKVSHQTLGISCYADLTSRDGSLGMGSQQDFLALSRIRMFVFLFYSLLSLLWIRVSGLMTARFLLDLQKWYHLQSSSSHLSQFVNLDNSSKFPNSSQGGDEVHTIQLFAVMEPDTPDSNTLADEHSECTPSLGQDSEIVQYMYSDTSLDRGEGSSSQC
jgi:hypothetical protein